MSSAQCSAAMRPLAQPSVQDLHLYAWPSETDEDDQGHSHLVAAFTQRLGTPQAQLDTLSVSLLVYRSVQSQSGVAAMASAPPGSRNLRRTTAGAREAGPSSSQGLYAQPLLSRADPEVGGQKGCVPVRPRKQGAPRRGTSKKPHKAAPRRSKAPQDMRPSAPRPGMPDSVPAGAHQTQSLEHQGRPVMYGGGDRCIGVRPGALGCQAERAATQTLAPPRISYHSPPIPAPCSPVLSPPDVGFQPPLPLAMSPDMRMSRQSARHKPSLSETYYGWAPPPTPEFCLSPLHFLIEPPSQGHGHWLAPACSSSPFSQHQCLSRDSFSPRPLMRNLSSPMAPLLEPYYTAFMGKPSPSGTLAARDPFSPQRLPSVPALMTRVPDDVLQLMFSKLEPMERLALGLVCRRWHRIEVRLRERLKLDYATYYPLTAWEGPHRGFLDSTLERILPQMTRLKQIEVTNIVKPEETPLTDDGLMLMGTWCKKLQVLRLNVCSQGLSGRGVTAVLLGCGRNLLELELQRCPGVGREAFKAIAEYCPMLQSLSLKACPLVSDQALAHFLTARCRLSLTKLNLGQCGNVRDAGLIDVAKSFPNLTSLDVSCCDVTDVGVLSLPSSCKDLRVFSARGCSDLSNVSMKAFAASSVQLLELDIRRARWITSAGVMAVLRDCAQLRKLYVDDSRATDEVRQLAKEQRVELMAFSSQLRTPQLLSWH